VNVRIPNRDQLSRSRSRSSSREKLFKITADAVFRNASIDRFQTRVVVVTLAFARDDTDGCVSLNRR
jgi:hypothetical protein